MAEDCIELGRGVGGEHGGESGEGFFVGYRHVSCLLWFGCCLDVMFWLG